jgi:hypothetical protein
MFETLNYMVWVELQDKPFWGFVIWPIVSEQKDNMGISHHLNIGRAGQRNFCGCFGTNSCHVLWHYATMKTQGSFWLALFWRVCA